MKEKDKIYTASDFARYHAGTMPAGEMHALEKAALEDPFLEDALEGYTNASDIEGDIKELKSRLDEKRKRKNVFFISSLAQNKMWRVAALVIIIAGAGYLFYRVNYGDKEHSLAQNEIKSVIEKKDSAVITSTDSTLKNNVAFEKEEPSKFTQKKKTPLDAAVPHAENKARFPPTKSESYSISSPTSMSKDNSHSDSTDVAVANSESHKQASTGYLLKGKVTDQNGDAVPFASIQDKSSNKATVTDANGLFSLRSKDSTVTAMASAPGFEAKSFSLKKDVQPTVAMNKSGANLEEVVVTGYSKRKRPNKFAATLGELNGKAAGVEIAKAAPEPVGGWKKFDQYLKQNASPVSDENDASLSGDVLLSFTLNKKGRPVNIKVVKSSCEACQDQAIQLLEDGPRWVGEKGTTGTVLIKFFRAL